MVKWLVRWPVKKGHLFGFFLLKSRILTIWLSLNGYPLTLGGAAKIRVQNDITIQKLISSGHMACLLNLSCPFPPLSVPLWWY